ncbi:MAG: fibronectin type III domain-containing protein [Actinomycetota bacterium]
MQRPPIGLFRRGPRVPGRSLWTTSVIVVVLAAFIGGFGTGASFAASAGPTYYVSTTGSDSNPGTFVAPWKTFRHAATQLTPGSTLYLRGGTYFEAGVSISAQGSATAPITIASYPGETAVLDGGLPYFAQAPNSEWQIVDPSIGLYRSVRTFPSSSVVRAWLLDDDVQLVQYSSSANLTSTYYGPEVVGTPEYIGPGIQLQSDGHLYMRLTPNPNDLKDATGSTIAAVPLDTDPNHHPMSVFMSDALLSFSGARYLSFENLRFQGSVRMFDGTATNITVADSRLLYGTYGIVVRAGDANWTFTNDEWDNGVPGWLYWTDVKDSNGIHEAYPEFQSEVISTDGPVVGFVVSSNTIRDGFDGVHLSDGSHDDRIVHNFFVRLHDDGMEIRQGAGGNVEVAGNMFWDVASGISTGDSSSTSPAGPVYIHNNVIDNSTLGRGGRPGNQESSNWVPWMTLDPSSTHSSSRAGWWDFYNNTIVTRRSVTYNWDPSGPAIWASANKSVYNNIFYSLDDRIIFRDDSLSSGANYDGDVVWRVAAPQSTQYTLLYNFGNGRSYSTLGAFQAAGLGWEQHGLQVDPGFDVRRLADPTFDPATIWSRYAPTNPQVLTGAVSSAVLGWPGTSGVTYRGAVGPTGDTRAPTVPPDLTATVSGSTEVDLSWSPSTDDTGVAGYAVVRNGAEIADPPSPGFIDTTVSPGTEYSYDVMAFDAAGNRSAASSPVTVVVPADPPPPPPPQDTQPPTAPANLVASAESPNAVDLSWAPSTDDVGVAGYVVMRGGTELANPTSTGFNDTTVSPGTEDTYDVMAFDAAGNRSAPSSPVTVLVPADPPPPPPPQDTQPPTVPQSVRAKALSSSQVRLSWLPSSDDEGVTGYDILRNRTVVDTVQATYFIDAGLAARTSYVYSVRANDGAGNHSSWSKSVKATTLSGVKTGSLAGRLVSSPTRAPLAGGRIKIVSRSGWARVVTTNARGFYDVSRLAPRRYLIAAFARGHRRSTFNMVVVANLASVTVVRLKR